MYLKCISIRIKDKKEVHINVHLLGLYNYLFSSINSSILHLHLAPQQAPVPAPVFSPTSSKERAPFFTASTIFSSETPLHKQTFYIIKFSSRFT